MKCDRVQADAGAHAVVQLRTCLGTNQLPTIQSRLLGAAPTASRTQIDNKWKTTLRSRRFLVLDFSEHQVLLDIGQKVIEAM